MQDVSMKSAAPGERVPSRLHHTAWVVDDQERTRAFYEGGLGFKLTAFWIEKVKASETDTLIFSHAFYGLDDGSALAFFCMAKPEHKERFKSPQTEVFNHIALNVDGARQDEMLERLNAGGFAHHTIDHGYCRSLYVIDPDGLRLEFTVDSADVERINAEQLVQADEWYTRWVGGHREPNNHLFVGHEREFAVAE